MKTKDFMRKVNELGYTLGLNPTIGEMVVTYEGRGPLPTMEDGSYGNTGYATINYDEAYNHSIEWKTYKDPVLLELIVEYSSTPISERKEEEFYLLELPDNEFRSKFLEVCMENPSKYRFKVEPTVNETRYNTGPFSNFCESYKMVFSEEEIEDLVKKVPFFEHLNKVKFEGEIK